METPDGTSLGCWGVAPVVVGVPQWVTVRYEPVEARVLGAGTSAVVPTSQLGHALPPGAIRVSPADWGTSTALRH
jgi:hypothetical protein